MPTRSKLCTILLTGALLLGCTLPYGLLAQTVAAPAEPAAPQPTPIITSDDYIPLDKKVLFDAADSTLASAGGAATYRWDFTDTPVPQLGEEVLHEFKVSGVHQVTLTITQGTAKVSVSKKVLVYKHQILLITDQRVAGDLNLITDQAADSGVYLRIASAADEQTGFLTEEKLVPIISEETDFIREADALIFFTDASIGLQAFTRYWQNLDADKKLNLQEKLLVNVTEQNMSIAAKLAQQSYQVMQPRYILVTRKEALNPIFQAERTELVDTLGNRGVEYRLVDARSEKSKLFFLSHAVTNFIAKGIPTNTIYLILAFPFITLLITFVRQIIGLTTFGVYTPTVLTLSLLILGIYLGIGTLLIVVLVSYLLRTLLNRTKLLYIPKTSLILSAIGLSFLAVIWILSYYRVSLAASLAIFPMLVMSTISEKFLSAQSEEGLREALWGVVKTIAVAVAAYYLIVWTAFNNLIMSWPELIIVPLIIMVLLGKFTGLRLTEYFRFRSLFKEKDIEE